VTTPQPGILLPIPPLARYLTFSLHPGVDPRGTLRKLTALADGDRLVAGIGESVVLALGRRIGGLRVFPSCTGAGFDIPSTPSALWIWARGEDRGELFHRSRHVKRTAQESFEPEAFVVRRSMPWAGLEDGITDALFKFTRPVSGAYFWCPALRRGHLDLAPLGL